jgi:DNA primase
MTDAAGNVLGIRLRRPNGLKFAVTGGKEGLFIPSVVEEDTSSPLLAPEGPTDTAALLQMGFTNVVGRPNCTGGIKLLTELVCRRKPREAVVVSDGDEPGRRGADNLASVLVAYAPKVRVIGPPAGIKDVRDWLRAGATRQEVEEAIRAAASRQLVIRVAEIGTQKG